MIRVAVDAAWPHFVACCCRSSSWRYSSRRRYFGAHHLMLIQKTDRAETGSPKEVGGGRVKRPGSD